jgi:hypothetical protein
MLKSSADSSIVEQLPQSLFEQKNSRFSHKTGSIALTNALGTVLTRLQPLSIKSELNCLDKSFLPRHGKFASLKPAR